MLKNESNDNNKLTDLLSQEITDEELRDLLEQLGEIEFAWSPKTTLKDVVEATSADPVVIGRLLAEIRKEDWEERFGLRLGSVENRVTQIENQQPKDPSQHSHQILLDSEEVEELRQLADERRREKAVGIVAVLIILPILLIIGLIASSGKPARTSNVPYSPQFSVGSDGKETYYDQKGDIVTNDHGKIRPATDDETVMFLTLSAHIQKGRSSDR